MPSSLLSVGTPSNLPTNSQKLHLVEALSKSGCTKSLVKTSFFKALSKPNEGSRGLRNRGLEVRILPGVLFLNPYERVRYAYLPENGGAVFLLGFSP